MFAHPMLKFFHSSLWPLLSYSHVPCGLNNRNWLLIDLLSDQLADLALLVNDFLFPYNMDNPCSW